MSCNHDFHWYMAAANEDGWKCVNCDAKPGEEPGYSPELDEKLIGRKVFAVLDDLHNAGIIYVSNGTHGECLVDAIAAECRTDRAFDQVTIARRILEREGDEDHAKFWRDLGDGIRAGKDPRERCHCGKIANVFGGGRATCGKHMTWGDEGSAP